MKHFARIVVVRSASRIAHSTGALRASASIRRRDTYREAFHLTLLSQADTIEAMQVLRVFCSCSTSGFNDKPASFTADRSASR
jgi:hypothetical protein